MKSKEEFKLFVKSHPELISYVNNNEMTWQKFYELYSLYDEDDSAWNIYLKKDDSHINNGGSKNDYGNISSKMKEIPGIGDLFNVVKNIKPEVLQQNINSIQKFLGFISDFINDSGKGSENTKPRSIYTPRPTHKMFED